MWIIWIHLHRRGIHLSFGRPEMSVLRMSESCSSQEPLLTWLTRWVHPWLMIMICKEQKDCMSQEYVYWYGLDFIWDVATPQLSLICMHVEAAVQSKVQLWNFRVLCIQARVQWWLNRTPNCWSQSIAVFSGKITRPLPHVASPKNLKGITAKFSWALGS